MSLAERAKDRELKTLIVDIERLPGHAIVKHRGLTIEGDFWDLGGWKHTIGYRIHADDVVEWPSTICFAAKWYETGKRVFAAAWEDGGADAMYRAAFDLYDEADIVITFNGVGFDNKHLMSGWTERGMGKPSTWKNIDLLKVARESLGWESKTLDSVCKRLGIPAKNDKYEVKVARAAMAGDVAQQRKLKRYNAGDTDITGTAYEGLLHLVKSHPHVAPSRPDACPSCGSGDVGRVGTYRPGANNYPEYRCGSCRGTFAVTVSESRGPRTRAL
jgi:RNase H-like protein